MSIKVTCPNPECARQLRLKDELAGQKVKCPDCEGLFVVPGTAGSGATGSGAKAEPDAMIGKRIAHYQILAKIGQGGMGAVYRARNLRLSKMVALKVLPPAIMAKDPSFVERFIREAQSTAQLEHPNVVTVHFVGSDAGHHFIEMQYVDGKTLAEILRDPENISASQATRITSDAARALEAAHMKGIVHRDIKPENIMLTVDGQVKVADFGLASLGKAGESVMAGGKVLGTPYYMSPEHCRGEATDARSDIYSLGATYYHALTGKPPFFGAPLSEVVKMQVTTPLPPPKQFVPTLPDAVNDVVMKMMAKRPEERYPSCAELLADLDRAKAALAPPETVDAGLDEVEQVRGASAVTKAVAVVVLLGLLTAGGFAGIYLIPWGAGGEKPKPSEQPKPEPAAHEPVAPVPAAPGPVVPEPSAKAPGEKPEGPPKLEPAVPVPAVPISAPPESVAKPEEPASKTLTIPEVSLLPSTEGASKGPTPPQSPARAPDEPKPNATEAQPTPDVDYQQYANAVHPIDQLIDERKYSEAAMKTNVLAAKVKGAAEHAALKRANIDRLKDRWERIKGDVNSGKLKLAMKDISKRYGYAGTLVEIGPDGLVGQAGATGSGATGSGKAKVAVKWDRLAKEDILNLWAAACAGGGGPEKDPESALALAAFCMEGTEKLPERAEAYLGMAGGATGSPDRGADIKRLVQEIEFLRNISVFKPIPKEEPKAEEAEKEEKPKPEADDQEKGEKEEKEEGKASKASSRSYKNYFKLGMKYPLDSPVQLSLQKIHVPRWLRFGKGKKGGGVELAQGPVTLPAALPKEDGAFDFWVRVSGPERPAFGLIWAVSEERDGPQGTMYPITAYVYKNFQVTFTRSAGVEPSSITLTTTAEVEHDAWTHLAIEWGEEGYRVYVNGELSASNEDASGVFGDVKHIGFYRWLFMGQGTQPPETKMKVSLDEVELYYPKKRRNK